MNVSGGAAFAYLPNHISISVYTTNNMYIYNRDDLLLFI